MSSPGPSTRRPSAEGVDDVCPICLCPMDDGFSRPENCQHRFDLDCLTEWSKLRLSCPSCRAEFGAIYTYEIVDTRPKLVKVDKVEAPKEAEPFDETNPHDFTMCEICAGGQHEELLLICDQCDKGSLWDISSTLPEAAHRGGSKSVNSSDSNIRFHTYCLTPPLDGVPTTEQWFCPQCEQTRNSLPSTSRTTAPSARTIRLVQRTALAERVRRLLQRSRRLLDISEESSEEESEEEDDDGDEEGDEDQEEGSDASSEEEEEAHDFFDDDARVLAEIGDDVPDDGPSLPSVQRRTKKQREAATKKKTAKPKKAKRKTGKRTTKGKKRKTKGKRQTRRSKRADAKEGPMDAFITRRGGVRDPVARLSLLGAGLEPVADEDPLVTENSRRFDRPLVRRKEERLAALQNETVEEEKPVADACDLLGSIIPEQMKTLAPGRLFAVRGGRFNTTDDFEKYKERKTNQLSSELKERLGIPVDKSAAPEESANASKLKQIPKNKSDLGSEKRPDDHRNGSANASIPPKKSAAESTANPPNFRVDREKTAADTKRTVDTKRENSGTAAVPKGNGSSYHGSTTHDRKSEHRVDRGSSRERQRGENHQRFNSKASENERSDKNNKERVKSDGQNQRSYKEVRQESHHRPRSYHDRPPSHHRHHGSPRHSGGTVPSTVPKAEESEQEDRVVLKKLDAVTNKEKGETL
ncbi:hypothetical protein Y032_0006g2970 [Ancylostoma ceylanicum]|uniref:RING-type domain-containing protein n=1 Tax=Ancylostoma ceylanicum TaxID=53326 RepID=A0A016VRL7_9BILA|nr:hypothetical protein Y032_0006g2970 [Ancylostoma ceylanicum]